MVRYSFALASVLALSLAVSSEGLRLNREGRHNVAGGFHRDTEELPFVQKEGVGEEEKELRGAEEPEAEPNEAVTENYLHKMFLEADADGDGLIDEEQFIKCLPRPYPGPRPGQPPFPMPFPFPMPGPSPAPRPIRRRKSTIRRRRTGAPKWRESKESLVEADNIMNKDALHEVFLEADADGDGLLDEEQFIKCFPRPHPSPGPSPGRPPFPMPFPFPFPMPRPSPAPSPIRRRKSTVRRRHTGAPKWRESKESLVEADKIMNKDSLHEVFLEADADGDGLIDEEQFIKCFPRPNPSPGPSPGWPPFPMPFPFPMPAPSPVPSPIRRRKSTIRRRRSGAPKWRKAMQEQ